MGCGFHTSRQQQQQWQPSREPLLLHSVLAPGPSEQLPPPPSRFWQIGLVTWYTVMVIKVSWNRVNPISTRGVDYAHDIFTPPYFQSFLRPWALTSNALDTFASTPFHDVSSFFLATPTAWTGNPLDFSKPDNRNSLLKSSLLFL